MTLPPANQPQPNELRVQESGAARSPSVMLSETEDAWEPMPSWALACLQLGYQWQLHEEVKRLCFVSMPCESAAAGLITLGALIRRLEDEHADDLGDHFGRLSRLKPGESTVLRHAVRRGTFHVGRRDPDGAVWLEEDKTKRGESPSLLKVLQWNANDWIFDGEPPVAARPGQRLPHASVYSVLSPNGHWIREGNLSTTDSVLAYSGRRAGQAASERQLDRQLVRVGDATVSVADLLAIHEWQPMRVSRVRYYNPRSKSGDPFDRPGPTARLIVADGPDGFRSAYTDERNRDASLIGVTCRTADTYTLEDFGEFISGLAQWFEIDALHPMASAKRPKGMNVTILRERSDG